MLMAAAMLRFSLAIDVFSYASSRCHAADDASLLLLLAFDAAFRH